MGELVDRDLEHLRLLQLGYYTQAGITGVFSLFGLIYALLGFLFMSGAIPPDVKGGDPKVLGAIFAGMGLLFVAFGALIALLTWLAGR